MYSGFGSRWPKRLRYSLVSQMASSSEQRHWYSSFCLRSSSTSRLDMLADDCIKLSQCALWLGIWYCSRVNLPVLMQSEGKINTLSTFLHRGKFKMYWMINWYSFHVLPSNQYISLFNICNEKETYWLGSVFHIDNQWFSFSCPFNCPTVYRPFIIHSALCLLSWNWALNRVRSLSLMGLTSLDTEGPFALNVYFEISSITFLTKWYFSSP